MVRSLGLKLVLRFVQILMAAYSISSRNRRSFILIGDIATLTRGYKGCQNKAFDGLSLSLFWLIFRFCVLWELAGGDSQVGSLLGQKVAINELSPIRSLGKRREFYLQSQYLYQLYVSYFSNFHRLYLNGRILCISARASI